MKGKPKGKSVTAAPEVAVTRARDGEVVQRVDHVAAIMRSGAWRRGVTGQELADEWGLPITTVEHYSAEAWKRVCSEADDAAKARPTIAGTLAVSMQQAADEREYKAVAALGDTWSKVVGARAPERHEVAVVVAQYDAMPKDGKVAWLRERAAKMLAEAERIEADDAG